MPVANSPVELLCALAEAIRYHVQPKWLQDSRV